MNVTAWCSTKGDWATFTRQGCRHCRDRRRTAHKRAKRDKRRDKRRLAAKEQPSLRMERA